jgi:tetratricopeptide (TPR) repeat protein
MYGISDPADAYYNQLVQDFRNGQLNLKRDVPPGLTKLADPYDPTANVSYREENRLHDVSYYKGKLYLYFGVTPALVLFWPYAVLTGHYLFHKQAVAIFCAVGFLASVALLCALRRRYFPEVSEVVVSACALALGMTTSVPMMLQRPDVWEVPISCAYAMVMLALGGIWRTLHSPVRRRWWLVAASLAYGLAVGARPTVLFGVVILLVPVIHAWISAPAPDRQRWLLSGRMLAAAVVPVSLIGVGLMLYNCWRFDNPFEFGLHYQLAGNQQYKMPHMLSLDYAWFNFRVYFLQPIRWCGSFPFVKGIKVPPVPTGQLGVDGPFGILTSLPLVWMALAVPLAWQKRPAVEHSVLRLFVIALVVSFGVSALTVCLYPGACMRYQVDFMPVLVLLAACGVFGLERALTANPRWRVVVRCGWIAALLFSVTVSLLMTVQRYAEEQFRNGLGQLHQGRTTEAMLYFAEALRIDPSHAMAHYYYAIDLFQAGRPAEAISHYEQVLRLDPGYPGARAGLLQAEQKLQQSSAGPPN